MGGRYERAHAIGEEVRQGVERLLDCTGPIIHTRYKVAVQVDNRELGMRVGHDCILRQRSSQRGRTAVYSSAYQLAGSSYTGVDVNTARRTHGFRESVIRGMTRLAREYRSINLAQGFPNFPAPEVLKEAAARAIHDDINQYAITWGALRLREALARKYESWYGLAVDPEREISVTCGATEAMISTLLAVVNPGDEVIVFEPFYENYGP